ncbi:hypothetical protein SK128_021195, partial [Halocaridina rubra]
KYKFPIYRFQPHFSLTEKVLNGVRCIRNKLQTLQQACRLEYYYDQSQLQDISWWQKLMVFTLKKVLVWGSLAFLYLLIKMIIFDFVAKILPQTPQNETNEELIEKRFPYLKDMEETDQERGECKLTVLATYFQSILTAYPKFNFLKPLYKFLDMTHYFVLYEWEDKVRLIEGDYCDKYLTYGYYRDKSLLEGLECWPKYTFTSILSPKDVLDAVADHPIAPYHVIDNSCHTIIQYVLRRHGMKIYTKKDFYPRELSYIVHRGLIKILLKASRDAAKL